MSADRKSLDSSVVLRLLVGEPASQFQTAIQFLTDQLSKKIEVFVGNQVLSEAYFALQYYYKIPKAEALKMLHGFTTGSGITTTKVAGDVLALSNLATAKPGFVDRLIHGESLSTDTPWSPLKKPPGSCPPPRCFPEGFDVPRSISITPADSARKPTTGPPDIKSLSQQIRCQIKESGHPDFRWEM